MSCKLLLEGHEEPLRHHKFDKPDGKSEREVNQLISQMFAESIRRSIYYNCKKRVPKALGGRQHYEMTSVYVWANKRAKKKSS